MWSGYAAAVEAGAVVESVAPVGDDLRLGAVSGRAGDRGRVTCGGQSQAGRGHQDGVRGTEGDYPERKRVEKRALAVRNSMIRAGFVAAGAAVVLGQYDRLAVALSALQMGAFTLLVWLPSVLTTPNAFQWSEFVISVALTVSGWVVADSYRVGNAAA